MWCNRRKERQTGRQVTVRDIVIIVILPEYRNRIHGQLKEYYKKRKRNMGERLKSCHVTSYHTTSYLITSNNYPILSHHWMKISCSTYTCVCTYLPGACKERKQCSCTVLAISAANPPVF